MHSQPIYLALENLSILMPIGNPALELENRTIHLGVQASDLCLYIQPIIIFMRFPLLLYHDPILHRYFHVYFK